MAQEVSLQEMLDARERRAFRQQMLLRAYETPLISFGMNIAGPVKDTALIRRAFRVGETALRDALRQAELPILHEEETLAPTGCEVLYAVRGDALKIKRLCVRLEDASRLGRLFDMDVIGRDGRKLDREAVGGGERGCLICGVKGRGCASRRSHTVDELRASTREIMASYFAAEDRKRVAELVTKALTDEVYTTPKPGLVDRSNNGSHRDMSVSTFLASAAALRPYWERCVELGQESAGRPPEDSFLLLRSAGRAAESLMLEATNGVNTHKGAIFLFGVLCGAIGRLWRADAPCRDAAVLLRECAAMTGEAMRTDFAEIKADPGGAETTGQRLYLRYGMTGVRGEVAEGFPSVAQISLPALRGALAAGYSRNDAGVYALLALIAQGKDTNMVARGGLAEASAAAREASELLARTRFPAMADIEELDRSFIRRNLSPGGCADLLAVTYFLYDWTESKDSRGHI